MQFYILFESGKAEGINYAQSKQTRTELLKLVYEPDEVFLLSLKVFPYNKHMKKVINSDFK